MVAYVLITRQPGAVGGDEVNAYGPDPSTRRLAEAGRLLADGATPPMEFEVIRLQPPQWGSA